MQHYCKIDLHSNNHVVIVIDATDKRVLEKQLSNDLCLTLKALLPYRKKRKVLPWNLRLTCTDWSMAYRNMTINFIAG